MSNDLNIIQRGSGGSGVLAFGDASGRGAFSESGAKTVQAFVNTLLTERGSMYMDPDAGTDIITAMRFGRIRTDVDLQTFAVDAVGDAVLQVNARQGVDTPADERLTGVKLKDFSIEPPVVMLYIDITTGAGNVTSVTVPLSSASESEV